MRPLPHCIDALVAEVARSVCHTRRCLGFSADTPPPERPFVPNPDPSANANPLTLTQEPTLILTLRLKATQPYPEP